MDPGLPSYFTHENEAEVQVATSTCRGNESNPITALKAKSTQITALKAKSNLRIASQTKSGN